LEKRERKIDECIAIITYRFSELEELQVHKQTESTTPNSNQPNAEIKNKEKVNNRV
jgi:hypothetical protein